MNMQDQDEARPPRRLLRNADLDARGLQSRATRWRGVRSGTFPAPVEIGPNSVGWYEDEIDAWLATRPRRTYGALTREGVQGAQQPISTTGKISEVSPARKRGQRVKPQSLDRKTSEG